MDNRLTKVANLQSSVLSMKTPNSELLRLTLRQQIFRILKREIECDYGDGEMLPGERTLAQRFGVSVATVREALQGLVDLGLLHRQRGLGTIVRKEQAALESLPVGILVEIDVSHPNASPYYISQALSLLRELEKRGIPAKLLLGSLRPGKTVDTPTCSEFRRMVRGRALRALVVLSWTTPEWQDQCEANGIPVIHVGNDCPRRVDIDRARFITEAVSDLVGLGRKRLALMTWEGYRNERSCELSESFRNELLARGFPVREEWIFSGVDPSLNGAGWEAFREIWTARKDHPDGIIITDDILLRGALFAIHEQRIPVPKQLVVISQSSLESMDTGSAPVLFYGISTQEVTEACMSLIDEVLADAAAAPRAVTLALERAVEAKAFYDRLQGAPAVGSLI